MAEEKLPQLKDPSGNIVDVSPGDMAVLSQAGYSPLTHADIAAQTEKSHFESAPQEILTGLEGAGSAATLGFSTGLERAIGVSPEDIAKRRQYNPGIYTAGQLGGLAASSLIPYLGEANILKAAGAGVAAKIGAETLAARIGSSAAQAAVETALFQGGDEVSKMFSNQADPDHPVQTAITNIGLAGLVGAGLGGGIGATNELWKAKVAPKIANALNTLKMKFGGMPEEAFDALAISGIDPSPEVKAYMSDSPALQSYGNILRQSDTTAAGRSFQKSLSDVNSQVSDEILNIIGKTPDEVAASRDLSDAEWGQKVQGILGNDLKNKFSQYKELNDIGEKLATVSLNQDGRKLLSDGLEDLSNTKGYGLSPSSPQAKFISNIQEEIPNIKTLEDLRKYQSIIGETSANPELWKVGKDVKGVFRNLENNLIDSQLSTENPEILPRLKALRQSYGNDIGILDDINSKLHVGRYVGPDSFIRAMKDMEPETFIRRLGAKNSIDLMSALQNNFSETSGALRDYQVNNMLRSASLRSQGNDLFNTGNFLSQSQTKLSPEYRNFLFTPEQQVKLSALNDVVNHINKIPTAGKYNFSNSARVMDALWSKMPEGLGAGVGYIAGGGPLGAGVGLALGHVAKEAPMAYRLGLLKFIGNGTISAEGFSAMTDLLKNVYKGENLTSRAVNAIFQSGKTVLSGKAGADLSDSMREKLDKRIEDLGSNPTPLFNTGGALAHYLPQHATALAQTASNAVSYLNSIRPSDKKMSPLDEIMHPTVQQKEEYNKALQIAQQPLSILGKIKEGTIDATDIAHLSALYPALYQKLKEKVTDRLINHNPSDNPIPYKTKMGLSVFLGQPMDSTMTPQAIQAMQSAPSVVQSQMPPRGHVGAMKNINKLAQDSYTGPQAREMARQNTKL